MAKFNESKKFFHYEREQRTHNLQKELYQKDCVIRSETEQRYQEKTAMRRDQNVKINQKRTGAKWGKKKKRGKIGMQEGIKKWQGCGTKEQALESRMKISSASHTGEQKQTTTTTKKPTNQQKKTPRQNNQKKENVKVCTLGEEKVI